MKGRTHALMGAAVGLATLPGAPLGPDVLLSDSQRVAWIAAWAGSALLPDLDHPGSTITHMWGPTLLPVSRMVKRVARGHRQGTHDALLAPLSFGCVALLASLWPVTKTAALALIVGLAIGAWGSITRTRTRALANLIASWGAAVWLTAHQGQASLAWLPLAVIGGVLVHIAGDAVTRGGVPIPIAWLLGRARRLGVPLMVTGGPAERWLVTPLLILLDVALVLVRLPR